MLKSQFSNYCFSTGSRNAVWVSADFLANAQNTAIKKQVLINGKMKTHIYTHRNVLYIFNVYEVNIKKELSAPSYIHLKTFSFRNSC